MSEISNEAVQSQIDQRGLKAGNRVLASDGTDATASQHAYVDSNSHFATGDFPFPVTVSGLSATSVTFADLTGTAESSSLTNHLVKAGNVTTFTAAGYAKVTITDENGTITDGDYFIQFGTIA